MFGLGPWEIGVVAVVLLVVMGPTVMPRLGRRLAETFIGVRSAAKELAETVQENDAESGDEAPKASSENKPA
ncbi:MAG: twin-arginine translocase TatA/TatE family subunit [Myxococcota bacterium]